MPAKMVIEIRKQPLAERLLWAMPRIYRTQKEFEQLLIREFLGHLGYRISNPEWSDRPDALLTLSKGRKRKRIAIEHTKYFNDTEAGRRSPLTPIAEFWQLVQASLIRRISHRKHLTGILATIKIKGNLSSPKLARQLAKELVNFVEAHQHQVRPSKFLRFSCRDFNKYPTLVSMLSSLQLLRGTDDAVPASRCCWTCANITTGDIRLNLKYIKSAIRHKNKKATKYNWDNANEKWLLIAACSSNLSNNAGPASQNVNWVDPELLDLCCESLFDRIVFWERVRCWYKWLKPSEKVVQYKTRTRILTELANLAVRDERC